MNRHTINLYTSKKDDHWATPIELYEELDKEFNFNFDPCPLYSLINYLKTEWKGKVFCNPPYKKVKEFIIKSIQEVSEKNCEFVVVLMNANTDLKWFHELVYNKYQIRLLKGRKRFWKIDENLNIERGHSAIRPSMLIIIEK